MISKREDDIEKGSTHEGEQQTYRLLAFSLILPPVFASLAVSGLSALVFIIIGFAYYYLAIIVLPVAFLGFGIAHGLTSRCSSPNLRARYRTLGYLAGYITGLELVFSYPLSSLHNSPIYLLVGPGVFGGLAASFYLSKIGIDKKKASSAPIDLDLFSRVHGKSAFRLKVLFLIVCAGALSVSWPYLIQLH